MNHEEIILDLFRRLTGSNLTVQEGVITLLMIQPGLPELEGWLAWARGREWSEFAELTKQEIARR